MPSAFFGKVWKTMAAAIATSLLAHARDPMRDVT
jgi:hypothetical protein